MWLLGQLGVVVQTWWLLLLPPAERRYTRFVDSFEHLPRWQWGYAFLLMLVGVTVYGVGFERFVGQFAAQTTDRLLEQAARGQIDTAEQGLALYWSGAVGMASYLLTPTAWLGIYLGGEGLLRILAGAASHAIGTPAAYALFAARNLTTGRLHDRRRMRSFGEEVEDEVAWHPRGADPWHELIVLSSRDKPWRPELTIEITGYGFYCLTARREQRRAGSLRVRYRLERQPESQLVRSLVGYDPPPAAAEVVRARAGGAAADPGE